MTNRGILDVDYFENPLPDELTQSYTIEQPTSLADIPDITMMAFSKRSAREIGEREDWRCNCGRGFKVQDGHYVIHMAHIDHTRNEDYDNPDNGTVMCVRCHIEDHINRGDYGAVAKLASKAYRNGLHTWQYLNKHREAWDEDRADIVGLLELHGLDPRDFIDF